MDRLGGVGAANIGMEEIQTEQLRAFVQEMLSESQRKDAEKVQKIIDGGHADSNTITKGIQEAINNLSSANIEGLSAIKNTLSDIYPTTTEAFVNLERMRVDAKKTVFAERFDDFVSVVRQRLERITNVVVELTKKPDMSQQDLMRIQYEVMQMSIVLDVASKVGDKGSQALQTLFRDK